MLNFGSHTASERNLRAERVLSTEVTNLAKQSSNGDCPTTLRLTSKHPLVLSLLKSSKWPVKTIVSDSRFFSFPILQVDDLYHTCEGGLFDNILEHIFSVMTQHSSLNGFTGDWSNFVSLCLRILSQRRFAYVNQHRMRNGFETGKKFGNFNARHSLATDLPFMIHSVVGRENVGLLLAIGYISLRTYLGTTSSLDYHLKARY